MVFSASRLPAPGEGKTYQLWLLSAGGPVNAGLLTLDTEGPKAIAHAAQNAERFRAAGDADQARMWERVELALREMRGPRQT